MCDHRHGVSVKNGVKRGSEAECYLKRRSLTAVSFSFCWLASVGGGTLRGTALADRECHAVAAAQRQPPHGGICMCNTCTYMYIHVSR